MAEKVLPKYLRQTTTGRIYAYAAELAKRNDMVPYFPEPVQPIAPAVQPPAIPPDLTPKVETPATGGKAKAEDKPKE